MNPATIKDVEKYLKPGQGWTVTAIVFLVLAPIYLAGLPWMSLFCLAIAALFFWLAYSAKKKLRALMTDMEATGEQGRILQDFAAAQSVFNGELRVGHHYLFGKGSGIVLRYGEIKQIYQHVQRSYFIETARTLQYVNLNGKTKVLCKIPLRDKGKDQVLQLMAFIQSKNPTVKLGYK